MIGVNMRFNDIAYYFEFWFENPADPEPNCRYDMYGNCYSLAQGKLLAIYDHETGRHVAVDTVDLHRSGLFRIQTSLYTSQAFSEPDDEDESIYDVLRRAWAYYEHEYNTLVRQYRARLGPPAFSGSSRIKDPAADDKWIGNPFYPVGEFCSPLAYWDHAEGRLQIGLQQEDKECPISLDLACYRIGGFGE
jgi:hypothetical protein